MEDKEPDSERLQYLQRGLGKLDEGRLEKAEKMLDGFQKEVIYRF